MLTKKKIIVTGGAGFIGSHTIVELYNAGFEPIIIDNFCNSDKIVLKGLKNILKTEIKYYPINCKDYVSLKNVFTTEKQISGVIHFAAFKNIGESVDFPLKYYSNNLGSLLNLLEVMEKTGVKNLIFSSTCAIYGEPDILPVSEDSKVHTPNSPYGNTKKMSEDILRDLVGSKSNFKVISLRYFNPIGAHFSSEIGEQPHNTANNLVPIIIQTALGKQKSFNVYGNDYNTPDGTCIRDFIHVSDLAYAHVKALQFIEKTNPSSFYDYFNIGTGAGFSVMQLINTFENITGIKLEYSIVKRREGDIGKIYADTAKANKVLEWKAERSLEDGIRDAWNWGKKISLLQ